MKYRNRRGRYSRDRRLYKVFVIAFGIYAVSMIGANTIWGWVKSFDRVFQVENSMAGEVITNESVKETRIQFLIDKIYQKAKLYGVSGYQLERTIECESRFNNIQSTAYKKGVREESYGIAQIHLLSHPKITKVEALNEEFSIEWAAQNFNKVTWYAYNRKLDKCNYENN